MPSPLVTTDDWPEPELRAAVLAGELIAVGACWASVAAPEDPFLRAASFAWSADDARLVAAERSAAWIWGARSRPPVPHDACVPYEHRVRAERDAVRVRETTIGADDVVLLGPVRVTSPRRTALDLLRSPGPFTRDAAASVAAMVEVVGVRAHHLRRDLAAMAQVPMARQAERRLRSIRLSPR